MCSTSFSNGTSRGSWASSTAPRARPISSAKVGSPERSSRSTSRFTKGPMTGSNSGRSRRPMGLPRTMSSWPVYQRSTTAQALMRAMYSVARSSRTRTRSCSESSRLKWKDRLARRKALEGGRDVPAEQRERPGVEGDVMPGDDDRDAAVLHLEDQEAHRRAAAQVERRVLLVLDRGDEGGVLGLRRPVAHVPDLHRHRLRI